MAQIVFEDFIAVIKELTVLVGHIAQVEDAKARAASEKHHELLDDYIQKEQAQILKLRGFEQRMLKLAKELGWDSLTFQQILEKAPLRQSGSLEPLFSELEQQLKRLQGSREASEQIIRVRIHEIQTAIARREGGSYDDSGNVNLNSPFHAQLKDTYV